MRVVVSGGTGFVGVALARRLCRLDGLTGPNGALERIEEIVLFDSRLPDSRPDGLDGRVSLVAGDIAERATVEALIDRDDCSVFHLASVVSFGAEQDFDLALRVNLTGALNLFEACRARPARQRVVATSTYAAFGGVEVASDAAKLLPQTTYGTTKVMLELLVNDYTRKGFLDGRTARLPTVVVRPGAPNLAASSWMSAVFREPLAGVDTELPVGLETRAALGGVRDVVSALVLLHEADGARLGHDRAVTLPSIATSAAEMVAALERVGAGRSLGAVTVRPDATIQRIVDGWPIRADASRALALGIPPASSLDEMLQAYLEDYVDVAAGPGLADPT